MKKLLLTLILGVLAGTAVPYAYSQAEGSPEANSDAGSTESGAIQNTAFMERARRSVRLELEGSEGIQFRNTRLVRNDEGLLVACGEVKEDRHAAGGETGFQRFVTMGHPESLAIEGRTAGFDEVWARYCSSSP